MKDLRLLRICLAMVLILGIAAPTFAREEITIEFWTIKLKDAFEDYFNSAIEEFEQLNPGVKIKWVDVANLNERLTTALVGRTTPDVVDNLSPAMWAKQGVFVNLDEYISEDIRSQYVDEYWSAGSLYKGGHYGIPFYGWGSFPLWYNKEMFAEAGLDPEKPPVDDEEMLDMGRKINAATGKYGYAYQTAGWGDNGPWDVFAKHDLDIFQGADINLVTPTTISILQNWVEAYQDKSIPPEAVTGTGRDPLNWFTESRCAMFIQGAWITRYFPEDLQDKIGVAPQPMGLSGKVVMRDADYLSVLSTSKHPKEAVEFALFLTNPKNQLEFAKLTGTIPTIKAALEDPFFSQSPTNLTEVARNVSAGVLRDYPLTVDNPQGQPWVRLMEILKEEIDKAFMGKQAAEQALRATQNQWESIYQPE